MKTIVILAHPNIEQSSINKMWVDSLAKNNPEVTIHNLYKVYPDGSIDVEAEQKELEKYDRIVFQYPMYWYNMTPLLKKWFDDVFTYGWAYGTTGDKLAGKDMRLVVSVGGAQDLYEAQGTEMVHQLLKPVEFSIRFVNANYTAPHIFYGALSPDMDDRLSADVDAYLHYVTA